MNNINNPLLEMEAPPRPTMTLILMLDTSGSMSGAKIGSLNSALEETVPELKKIAEGNADAEIKIAIMEFSSGFKWLTPAPVPMENFEWTTSLTASGVTDLGSACEDLAKKLSRKEGGFMLQASASYAPVLILMSDGGPTDNFEAGMKKLEQNNWYKAAIKCAMAIGNDADKAVLARFTGTPEAVVEVHNSQDLIKMVRFIAVTSTQIGSTSTTVSDNASDQIDLSNPESTTAQETLNTAIQSETAPLDNTVATDIDW